MVNLKKCLSKVQLDLDLWRTSIQVDYTQIFLKIVTPILITQSPLIQFLVTLGVIRANLG